MCLFYAVLVLVLASGCTRAVLVPESSPIRVGQNVRGRVYVREQGKWIESDNEVQIPEGWYCVPPSYVEDN